MEDKDSQLAQLMANATPAEEAGIRAKGDLSIQRRTNEEEEDEVIAQRLPRQVLITDPAIKEKMQVRYQNF